MRVGASARSRRKCDRPRPTLRRTMSCRSACRSGSPSALALSLLILLGVSILVFAATQALPGDPRSRSSGTRRPGPARGTPPRARAGPPAALAVPALARRPAARAPSAPRSTRASRRSSSSERGLDSLALVSARRAIAIPLSLLLGTFAAVRRDRPSDHASQTVLLVLTALPEFVIGLGLLLLLATSVFHALPAVALIPPGDNAFEHPRSWRCRCSRSCSR